MYGKIRQALIAAYKKDTPDCGDNIDVILDENAHSIELVVIKTVVEILLILRLVCNSGHINSYYADRTC